MSHTSRRDFFKKLSLSVVGATNISGTSPKKEEKPVLIKSIKQMGFNWDTLDPFLFCVHHEDFFPKGNAEMGPDASLKGRSLGDDFIIKDGWRMYHGKKVPGFPGHPHIGFETITIVRKGIVDHADSLGAAGRYGEGDVQWMTAGKGVQHSEMFPLIKSDEDNPLELFQVWLNLPAKNKMTDPHFKMLWGKTIPKITQKDAQGNTSMIELIAGRMFDQIAPAPPPGSWAADPENEVCILNIHMDAHATLTIPAAGKGINRVIYFYEGDTITLGDRNVPKYHSVELSAELEVPVKAGNTKTKVLMLQGRPINETVIQYGPFVMNSKEEIHQAFNDFHATKFGGWPWPKYDQVHDRSLPRFARHADGRYEEGV